MYMSTDQTDSSGSCSRLHSVRSLCREKKNRNLFDDVSAVSGLALRLVDYVPRVGTCLLPITRRCVHVYAYASQNMKHYSSTYLL